MQCTQCGSKIPEQKIKQSRVLVKYCSGRCQWSIYNKKKLLATCR